MNSEKRTKTVTALLLTMGLSLSMLTGCGSAASLSETNSGSVLSAETGVSSAAATGTSSTTLMDTADLFSDRDLAGTWEESEAVSISLNGDSASCDSDSVSVEGSTVTITGAGVYVLSGTLTDGQIVVDADSGDKVQLVLNGVTVSNSDSAALYVKQADKVFLTLAEGTENALSTTGEFVQTDDNNVDGVVFSKDDLTVNGSGALTVTSEYGHGIVSKDDLTLTGGTLTVTVSGHALSGKDSVCIADGVYTLTAGKDGIHSENADDTEKGFIVLEGGTFTITSQGDGLDASNVVQVDGGTLNITSGGGSANAEQKHQEFFGRQQQDSAENTAAQEETASVKGIKSDLGIAVNGGTVTVDSADDAFHSNGEITITGGTLSLTSGDDGIHADGALTISGGTLTIPDSYEGLEGLTIDISGGDITLKASDDGLNAAGGSDGSGTSGPMGGYDQFAAQEGVSITISGGTLTVDAEGDGLDSNGDLTISGGTVYVYGPLNSGNGAMDHNGTAVISEGSLIAVSCSGMEEGFDSTSEQGTIAVGLDSTASGKLTLTDSAGTVLLECTPTKEYSVVQLSCAGLKTGETYTLTAGDQSVTIEMDSLHYGQLSGMGGGMGSMGGGRAEGSAPSDGAQQPEQGAFPGGGTSPDADGQTKGKSGFPGKGGMGKQPMGGKSRPDQQSGMSSPSDQEQNRESTQHSSTDTAAVTAA